jgi:adenosylmethionine-8-amino-7-oxononanoate aminotransferase
LRVRAARHHVRLRQVRLPARHHHHCQRPDFWVRRAGAAIISDRIFEPFSTGTTSFAHGYTFGGHPVACAAALANLDVFEKEDLLGNVLRNENAFRATLEKLLDLPIVGDVRGNGYFWSVELVKTRRQRSR